MLPVKWPGDGSEETKTRTGNSFIVTSVNCRFINVANTMAAAGSDPEKKMHTTENGTLDNE